MSNHHTDSNTALGAELQENKPIQEPREADAVPTVSQPSRKYGTSSLVLIAVAFMSTAFLVALDVNILATAIPKITSQFGRLDHVSWYGAAYSLAKMAFQPSFGRVCAIFPLKVVFYYSSGLFAVGTIICATAPKSEVFILGRAVQGWGAAGLFSTVLTMSSFIISKRRLPVFLSILTTTYVVASVVGPILGGVFAGSYLTWRFCFWINLPIAGISVILIFIFVTEPKREYPARSPREKVNSLDIPGTLILIASITLLILALQWGGITRPWDDPSVWGSLVGFGVTLLAFVVLQIYQKERALIPVRIIMQRTIAASCAVAALLFIGIDVPTYLLPLYFQASKGVGSATSGLLILPLAAVTPVASLASGVATTVTGLYVPWMVIGSALSAIGYGLLSTLDTSSGLDHIIGYQVIASIGFGMAAQLPLTAMRNVLVDDNDIPLVNALIVFFQGLGTSISLSSGQSIFLSTLRQQLQRELPTTEVEYIINLGAGQVTSEFIDADALPRVADAYASAIATAMYLAVASSSISFICSATMEWKRLDKSAK